MEPTKNGVNIKGKGEQKPIPVNVYNFSDVQIPEASEKGYEGWVTYGDANLFPQDLITAWLQSSMHNALTTGIAQMIAGAGLKQEAASEESKAFQDKVNRHGDTLDDIVTRTAFDLYLHGYFGWQVVWNATRTKIAEIYHTPAEQIRAGIADDDGNVDKYYTSWNWEEYRKKRFEPTAIPIYNPLDRSAPRQMMFNKQYRPNQYYYSTPSYFGGLTWIMLDNRVGEFHLNNIANGFFPSSVIQFFNGDPTQEEKRAIETNFMNKFTGIGSAKLVFVYNNNREEQVSFETYEPANLDKRFKELMPEIQKNIMMAHRVSSPLLFGVREGGGLGNNSEELESSSVLMNKMMIVPFQQIIIDALVTIFKVNGWPLDMNIETLQPLQFLEGDKKDAEAESRFSKERKVLPDHIVKSTLKHLAEVGQKKEDLEKDGWILVQEDQELTKAGIELKLTPVPEDFARSDIESDPEEKSKLDTGLYKIRYEYRGPRDTENRDFCGAVLDMGLVYRKEDIDEMSANDANEEFGHYSIFDYKGSYGCRHKWHRLVFFRKRNTKGQFLPSDGLLNDKQVGPGETPSSVIPPDAKATTVNPRPT